MGIFDFNKPRTPLQWIIFLAAIGITLSSTAGTRAFSRDLRRHISRHNRQEKFPLKPAQVSMALYYARKRKLIDIREDVRGNILLFLTERGKKRKLEYDLENLTIVKPSSWDGKWRLLLFDVPESMKRAREALREKLKQLGFFQFQKSVWIYPYRCENEIDFIAEVFSIASCLTLFTIYIENDKMLRSYFRL